MSRIEDLVVAQQAATIVSNVKRDLKRSAVEMKQRIAEGVWTLEQAVEIRREQCQLLQKTLNKLSNNERIAQNALARHGVTPADLRQEVNELSDGIQVADSLADDGSDLLEKLDVVISEVGDPPRLF